MIYSPKSTIVYHRIYNLISQAYSYIPELDSVCYMLDTLQFSLHMVFVQTTGYIMVYSSTNDEMNENIRKVCFEQNIRRDIKLAVSFA